MFEYNIRKNKPGRSWNIGKDNGVAHLPVPVPLTPINSIRQRALQQQPRHEAGNPGMLRPDEYVLMAKYNRKDYWIQWIDEVKEKYPQGKILTLKMIPIILNRPTAPWAFFVDFIQEVRQLAQWDKVAQEPRVVGMRPIDKDSIYNFAAPSALRELTEEEMRLVLVQHPKIQERIAECLKKLIGEEEAGESSNSGYAG